MEIWHIHPHTKGLHQAFSEVGISYLSGMELNQHQVQPITSLCTFHLRVV